MENKNRNTKIRRTIKAAFIAAALIMFIGTMVGTNLSDLRDTGATIANAFAVLFGIMGASLGATLARSLVKIPSPSRKLLVIVSISCGAGFVIGTLLSGFILHLAFALSLIVGIISIIAGIFAYIAAYSATIVICRQHGRQLCPVRYRRNGRGSRSAQIHPERQDRTQGSRFLARTVRPGKSRTGRLR